MDVFLWARYPRTAKCLALKSHVDLGPHESSRKDMYIPSVTCTRSRTRRASSVASHISLSRINPPQDNRMAVVHDMFAYFRVLGECTSLWAMHPRTPQKVAPRRCRVFMLVYNKLASCPPLSFSLASAHVPVDGGRETGTIF